MSVTERPQLDGQTDDVRVAVGAATDIGGRGGNEDMVHVGDLPPTTDGAAGTGHLLAVADGMGGHERGEVASRLAIETVTRTFAEEPGADPALLLKQAFRRANDAIYANGHGAAADQMMGTTLVVAALRGKYATIASIGDSRAYLVRANALTQVTKDHSLVAEQVSQGAMTALQARASPHRNILTHVLGHQPRLDPKVPGIFELTLLPEDRLLLCTDGFYDVVADADFVRTLLDHEPDAAAKRLVDLAVERGTSDNVSAVVARVLPTRVSTVERELAGAPAGRGPLGGSLVPVLVAAAVLLFVALVLLALTVL